MHESTRQEQEDIYITAEGQHLKAIRTIVLKLNAVIEMFET